MPCSDCCPIFAAHAALNRFKPNLFTRARSNQSPVYASERSELIKFASHAENELADYDKAIAKLQQLAITLENRKQSLKTQLALAKSLVAPIRKLPPEVLRQIFIAHGTDNVFVFENSDRLLIPGFKVASVCSYWRSVALTTIELWDCICVVMRSSSRMWWSPNRHSALSENLLKLSANSPLTIILDIPEQHIPATPHILRLLCEQAPRWKSVRGVCNTASLLRQCIDGRSLDSLETFKLIASSKVTTLCIENAPKLHIVTLFLTTAKQTNIPWDQITDLTVARSCAPDIIQSLAKMPKLSKLQVLSCDESGNEDEYDHRPVQSHLRSLNVIIRRPLDELAMTALLDALILPKLHSLSIVSERGYITNQDESWASNQLPSSMLRSSPPLMSFKLEKTWMCSNDLISLLGSMPTLTTLCISEPSHSESMINDQLIVSLIFQPDRQSFLKRLTSLTLEGCRLPSFSVKNFADMILSRWKPSYLIGDDVARIRTARLHVSVGSIAFPDIAQIMELREGGLDIIIEDEDGDVLFGVRNYVFLVPRE